MRVQGYVHIDLADPAPKIIDGYWHEWIDGVWVNTGIKAEGTDGISGDGFVIRYIRSNSRPQKPTNGVLDPPGWMTEIDNPINNDIYWPSFIGKWTKQANGEYKSAPIGHNENSPLRFQFYNRTAGSDLRITVRTSSHANDKLFVGKIDEELGENNSNNRLNFGGTQSQDLVYALPYKGEHYIQFDYKKDGTIAAGDDAAYIKVTFPEQPIWMVICTIVGGVMQPWSEPSLFIDSRIEETIASADRSKAVTDKFGTTQEGGLIQTVMMLLREYNSQIVTAGISGIQGINRNHPAFWAGGTSVDAIAFIEFLDAYENEIPPEQFNYKEKYDALAKIIFLHNGAAKVGDFIVRQNGTIMMIDPELGIQRLVFTASNLPLITDLVGGLNSSGGMDVGSGYLSGATSSSVTLSGSTNVTKAGAEVTYSGARISLNGSGTAELNGMSNFIEAGLYLYVNNVQRRYLGSAMIHFTSPVGQETIESEQVDIPAMKFTLNEVGVVTLRLEIRSSVSLNMSLNQARITASRLDWKHVVQGVRRLQIGRDGIMAVYSNNHTHISENGGVDIRGKTNMPGVLLSGTVLSGGGGENFWGAKQSGTQPRKDSTGRYTIYHTIGHNRYSVSVLPKSANRSCQLVSQSNTDFVVEFRTIGSSPALADTAFTIQVTGDNYS